MALIWKVPLFIELFMKTIFKMALKLIARPVSPHITVTYVAAVRIRILWYLVLFMLEIQGAIFIWNGKIDDE